MEEEFPLLRRFHLQMVAAKLLKVPKDSAEEPDLEKRQERVVNDSCSIFRVCVIWNDSVPKRQAF